MPRLTESLSHTLTADPSAVPAMRRLVVEFARRSGAEAGALDEIRLAVTEAVTNVVLHAYVDEPGPGPVAVEAHLGDEVLHVTVSDEGRGMTPRVDSPGLGLGLPLIAHAARTFDVHRPDGGGTRLELSFPLGARVGAA